ncbi:MAG TPA: hypothetical protein PKH29_03050 [Oscillospiraceae bacterium]|nr:hypothetical protein [Oscillospiraceae bacterium]
MRKIFGSLFVFSGAVSTIVGFAIFDVCYLAPIGIFVLTVGINIRYAHLMTAAECKFLHSGKYVDSYERVVELTGRDVADLFGLGPCPAAIYDTRLKDMTGRDLGWLLGVDVSAVGYSTKLSDMTVNDLGILFHKCLSAYAASTKFMDLTGFDLERIFGVDLSSAGFTKVCDMLVMDIKYSGFYDDR